VGFLAAQSLKVKPSRNFDADRLAFEPADGPSGVNGISDSARRRPMSRLGQVTGGVLLLLETAFLVASGAQLWPSSAHGVTSTPSVTVLRRTVGDSTVGFGAFTCFAGPAVTGLGILPESNSLFAVHEFDFYDPIFPQAYLKSWADVSRSPAGVPIYNSFCPALTRASQARRFGVEFVLESDGAARPKGAIFDRRIGDEDLYRIPDSGEATLTPESPAGRVPPVDALGTPVKVDHPSPSSWRIVTRGHGDQVLRLRLTDEPGWRATIDGHPLVLSPYAGVMMQAHVPAGRHVIEVEYWPSLFTLGLVLAGCCGVLLVASSALALKIRRSERGGHD
jgi:hypothetical protein